MDSLQCEKGRIIIDAPFSLPTTLTSEVAKQLVMNTIHSIHRRVTNQKTDLWHNPERVFQKAPISMISTTTTLLKRMLAIGTILAGTHPLAKRTCPCCGYHGYFLPFGHPLRIDAQCPSCRSLERHRLFFLWYEDHKNDLHAPILHFAPEKNIKYLLMRECADNTYRTADLLKPADLKLNIEAIEQADECFQSIICNHVLEHVDDERALKEMYRILSPGGTLIVSVPLIEGWNTTYENASVTTPEQREIHFGQNDHLRLYGKDFRNKLHDAGFEVHEVTAEGVDVITYGLWPGEKLFVCRKKMRTA